MGETASPQCSATGANRRGDFRVLLINFAILYLSRFQEIFNPQQTFHDLIQSRRRRSLKNKNKNNHTHRSESRHAYFSRSKRKPLTALPIPPLDAPFGTRPLSTQLDTRKFNYNTTM